MLTPIFLKGGFSSYMKTNYNRCFICLLTLFLFISAISPLSAFASTDIPFSAEPWCHTMIFPEDEMVVPTTIIVYLPGAGHTGSDQDDLERFARANHPVKYSRENTIPMPDDCVIVCFQAHGEYDFRKKSDELCEVIHALSASCPEAKVILAGHSNGALATYKIAAANNPDIDGYVFISGTQIEGSEKLSLIPNCLVVYGYESLIACRRDFSNLFYNTDITDEKYREEISYVEEVTNNAYFVSKKWNHSTAPEVFQEDFFWEWVSNVTPLTE